MELLIAKIKDHTVYNAKLWKMITLGTSKINKPTPTGCMNVDVLIPEGLNSNQITITISIIVSVGS